MLCYIIHRAIEGHAPYLQSVMDDLVTSYSIMKCRRCSIAVVMRFLNLIIGLKTSRLGPEIVTPERWAKIYSMTGIIPKYGYLSC